MIAYKIIGADIGPKASVDFLLTTAQADALRQRAEKTGCAASVVLRMEIEHFLKDRAMHEKPKGRRREYAEGRQRFRFSCPVEFKESFESAAERHGLTKTIVIQRILDRLAEAH